MTTHHASFLASWRVALSRIVSGPLLGWICLGTVLFAMAAYGLAVGEGMWYVLVPGPLAAAAGLNACTWLAAIAIGRTRQLRSSWISCVALLWALATATEIWRSWGQDLDLIVFLSQMALGFPTSLIMWFLGGLMPRLPGWSEDLIGSLVIVGLGYLQAFVLLPLLFESRAKNTESAVGV